MSWFYLALLAPLLYAVVNLFDDNLLHFVYKSPYLATTFAGAFGALPLLSLLLLHTSSISLSIALLAITAGFLTVSYYFFYFRGLQADMPSTVIVLLSLEPAFIPLFAYFINHERLNGGEVVGFIIVLLATLGLAAVDLKKLQFSKALMPAIVAIVLMDAAAILSKYAYQHSQFYTAYMCYCGGMGLGGIAFLSMRLSDNKRQLNFIKTKLSKILWVLVVAEAFNLAAEFTLNLAISRGPVSLVKVIESIQPIFVLIIAVALYPLAPRYFREVTAGHLIKKFALMTVVVAGLSIIGIAAAA